MKKALIIVSIVAGVILLLCLIIALLYVFVFVKPDGKEPEDKSLLCDYAHRGLHGNGVPENSLKAFELACQEGYGIELDVQLSADGRVVVYHDYSMERLTSSDKKLNELTCEELTALQLGDSDQYIPTFEQALEVINGRVPVLVELKGEEIDASLCPKVAEILKEYNGSYCIESFNPLLVKEMKKLLPDAYCGLLYTNVLRDKVSALNLAIGTMALNFLCEPDFIAYNEADRDSIPVKLTTRFHKTPKFVWTVRTEDGVDRAHELGEYPIFEKEN